MMTFLATRRPAAPVLAAAITTALLACASKKVEEPYATTDLYCVARAQAECSKVADSCLASAPDCQGARKQRCMAEAAAAVSTVRSYKPANVQACLDAITLAYSDTKLTVAEEDPTTSGAFGGTFPYACARVFEGSAQKADKCTTDFDCVAGLVCGTSRASNEKRCATKTSKRRADECANAGDTCEAGSFCSARAVCDAAKAKEEPCSETEPCGERLRCDPVAKKCVDRVSIGQGCAAHTDCLPEAPYCLPLQVGSQCAKDLTFAPGVPSCRDYGKP